MKMCTRQGGSRSKDGEAEEGERREEGGGNETEEG